MASLSDIIKQQVTSAAGNVDLSSEIKDKVLGGLSDSILGSLTQTATKAGGLDSVKALLTGKDSAEKSPVTELAGNLFKNNVLKGLNLDSAMSGKLTSMIPMVLGSASSFIKDKDGDGDVDLNDIIATLAGSGAGKGIFKSILGGLFGKK